MRKKQHKKILNTTKLKLYREFCEDLQKLKDNQFSADFLMCKYMWKQKEPQIFCKEKGKYFYIKKKIKMWFK